MTTFSPSQIAAMTPAVCGTAFNECVQELVNEQGLSILDAWKRAKVLNADLFAKANTGYPTEVTRTGAGPAAVEIPAALANAYRTELAKELTRNGGDLDKAHTAVMAGPALRGIGTDKNAGAALAVKPITLPVDPKNPYGPVLRSVLSGVTSIRLPIDTKNPYGAALSNDDDFTPADWTCLAFLAGSAADTDPASNRAAALAHGQAMAANQKAANDNAVTMHRTMAKFYADRAGMTPAAA